MNKELTIKCIQDSRLSCLQRPIATVLNWYGKDYRYMFSSSWFFSYDYMENYMGILKVPELVALLNNTSKYTGIEFSVCVIKQDQRISFIERELFDNRPVVIYIDSFWCPWFPSYMKSHVHHYVLAIGIDRERNVLVCLDKLETQGIVILPFKDYIQGSGEILSVTNTERCQTENIMYDAFTALKPDELKNNIFNFSDLVQQSLNVELQLENYHDARVAPIYTWLKGVSNDRLNYSAFLKLLSINNLSYYENELELLANEWRSIIILLVRAGNRENNVASYDSISDRINNIAKHEYHVMKKLKESMADECNI